MKSRPCEVPEEEGGTEEVTTLLLSTGRTENLTEVRAPLESEPEEAIRMGTHMLTLMTKLYFAYITQLALNSAALFLMYVVIMT